MKIASSFQHWTMYSCGDYIQLFRKYQAASPGSRAFKASLVEMIAVAIHQVAAYLYKLDLDLGGHKDEFVL